MTQGEWEAELAELERRRELVAARGGTEGIERQQRAGKLVVDERLELLADAGTLRPFASLRGSSTYSDDGSLDSFLPIGQVDATCEIDGRKVVVNAGDFTVRGGSASGVTGGSPADCVTIPHGRSDRPGHHRTGDDPGTGRRLHTRRAAHPGAPTRPSGGAVPAVS